jgi:aminoglycoside 3-N-acetyltransferase
MVTYRDLIVAFRKLGLNTTRPIIAHASLSAFGDVHGGAETLLGALLSMCSGLLMPTFTYNTMVIPETGPANNALVYGSGKDRNQMAEFFSIDMPADQLMGVLAETLRCHERALRSPHPILSFAGINTDLAVSSQTIAAPLAPLKILTEMDGWVVLLGVTHTVNTSIHYGEQLAGRSGFTRWALTVDGIQACPGFPGCSDGFNAIAPSLEAVAQQVTVGTAQITAVPMAELVRIVSDAIKNDPYALLCERTTCERCQAVRRMVVTSTQPINRS